MNRAYRRHDLVWLDPGADAAAFVSDAGDEQIVRPWIEQGWPFVVARQPGPADGRWLSIGFTLPPPPAHRRVALCVPNEKISRHSGPLSLAEAMPHIPSCQEMIHQILILSEASGAAPCVYGSSSWQALTGRSYLTALSDLDVLFICDEKTDIFGLTHGLAGFTEMKPRLDGEILVPAGWAVAWRELCSAVNAGGAARVLAKSSREARLVTINELLGQTAGLAA